MGPGSRAGLVTPAAAGLARRRRSLYRSATPNSWSRAPGGRSPRRTVRPECHDRHARPPRPRSRRRPENLVRLAGLPQGAGRFRADPHPPSRRGLRAGPPARRRRRGDRQHLRLPRLGQGGVALGDRRGHGGERPGDRHRLHGRAAGGDPREVPRPPGGDRAPGLRVGGGGRPRGGAAGPRPVPRPRAAAGDQAHPAPLRLSSAENSAITCRTMPAIRAGSPPSRCWSPGSYQFQHRCMLAERGCSG